MRRLTGLLIVSVLTAGCASNGAPMETYVASRILLYVATVVATYYLASFVQASLHSLFGHTRLGRSLYKVHVGSHHGVYSKDILMSDRYSDEEESLTFYYVIPTVILVGVAYLILALDLLVVHLSSLALAFYAHVYLHVHYHLKDSWLRRFEWFKRKQRLHFVHHRDMSKNFAVVEFFWDRVFGTYRSATA